MHKNIKLIVTVVVLFLISVSFGRQRDSQPVEFKKISDNLYEIVGGSGARTGAYIGDNGVFLIDSKMDKDSVNQVIDGIRKLTDKSIKYLVNTHSDGDHVAGNRYLSEPVTFVAHENCRKDFFGPDSRGNPSEWSKPELLPFVPSVTFRDKMKIYLGSKKVELWYFGVGHTTGDTVLYFPEEKTAFIGDQMFLARPQLIHSYKGGNSFEHVKTLTKMLETIDAEKFCSGHSEIVDRAQIKEHIAQMKEKQEKVKTLMKEGKNLEQIKAEFDQTESRLIESIYGEVEKQPR
jgi:glyoxylase-like metal-dependent hydrolase (beta-lactamase superfamily II)